MHLEKSDVNQAGIIIGGIEARHVHGVTALVPWVVHWAIWVLSEPFSHVTVATMECHDSRELDECSTRSGHGRLPTAQFATVGVVQQEEVVLSVVVGGFVIVGAGHCRCRWCPSVAAVLVENGWHEPSDYSAPVNHDQYGHRGHGGQCRKKRYYP